jgi:isopentenyl diphosphate isomerase/L-lactate dehydrogenase-like FMN-dependent dehydrogenase
VLYGLVTGGEDGVARVLSVLRDELARVMTLCGCETVRDVTPRHVSARVALPRALE